MPETGFPFNPPGPWFNNQGSHSVNLQIEVDPNFIDSATVVYAVTLTPGQVFPGFISTVAAVYAVETNPSQFNSAGSFSWVCPAGVTQVTAQLWAGGGNGGANATNHSGGGGGGGAYASGTIAVTPGNTYTVTVGGVAGDSSFVGDAGAQVVAKGGTSASGTTHGSGGTAAASTGDIKRSGADGGDGASTFAVTGGAGGGGSGGSSTAGTAGASSIAGSLPGKAAGAAGTPDGGAGGRGSDFNTNNAVSGTAPGGGGGGTSNSSSTETPGAGAAGKAVISWGVVVARFIPSVTVVYAPTPWIQPGFIASATTLHAVFNVFGDATGSGTGNGGESFRVQLAPNGTSQTATVAASIGTSDTLLSLTGDSGFPSGACVVTINSETLYVAQITAGSYRIRGRGLSNTTAASHTAGATVTWNDHYDQAIIATETIGKSVTANITGTGSTTYNGWLVCFDSSQAYLSGSRYPMHVTSVLGVFAAGAGSGGTNSTDGAEGNAVCTPAAAGDDCPAGISKPLRLTADVNIGDVALVRYTNPEASVLELGSRSVSLQSWFGIKRVDATDHDVTLTDPAGIAVDGTSDGQFLNPLGPGVNPDGGTATNHDIHYTTTTLPGTDRTFTFGPPHYSEKGWPIGVLAVRQGNRRIPLWRSWDWHDYNYVYSGFDTDATFAQMVANDNGLIQGTTPIINLPGPQDITGPDAMWDDGSYYFSVAWYVVLFSTPYLVIGPSVGGAGGTAAFGGGTTTVVPTVSFPPVGGPVVIPPVTEGGSGGGVPAPTGGMQRFYATLV